MLGDVYDTQILNNIIINMNFIKLTVELEIYIIYKSSIFFLKEIEITWYNIETCKRKLKIILNIFIRHSYDSTPEKKKNG
jgi:hypothetical protein